MSNQEIVMNELRTVNELKNYIQNTLAPRVDKVGFWARIAAIGAFVGGCSTFGLVVLEIIKTCRN